METIIALLLIIAFAAELMAIQLIQIRMSEYDLKHGPGFYDTLRTVSLVGLCLILAPVAGIVYNRNGLLWAWTDVDLICIIFLGAELVVLYWLENKWYGRRG